RRKRVRTMRSPRSFSPFAGEKGFARFGVCQTALANPREGRQGRRAYTPLLQVQTSRLRLARPCLLPRKGGEGHRALTPAPVRSEALSICDCPELAGAAIDELTSSYIMTPLRRLG